MVKVLLILAVISAIAVFALSKKLRDGEIKLSAGRQKLAENDNLFVRTFFNSKLESGRQKLADGMEKLSFWKKVRLLLVLVFIACAVCAVIKLVN